MKTKFINSKIFTNNDTNDILFDSIIIISNNIIEYIGPNTDIEVDRVIDCKGNILMSGLINAHTHTTFGNIELSNISSDTELNTECDRLSNLGTNDVYDMASMGYRDMIRNGITTVVDLNPDALTTAKAMVDTGIRGVVGVGYNNSNNLMDTIKELRKYNVGIVAYVHNMYNTTEEDFANYLSVCKSENIPFVTNASETLYDVGECDNEYGMTPIELLENYGMFDIPCIIAGATHVDKEEMQILSSYDVNVVSLPSSDLVLGHGVAPIFAYKHNNINVCIGTDSVGTAYDIFKEISTFVSLQKGIMHNMNAIDSTYAIKCATINSAKAYGLDKIGVLQNGNFADIIIVQASNRTCNICDSIVNYTNPSNVLLTMIDGNIVYNNM